MKNNNKKVYTKPSLKTFGSVTNLTMKGGSLLDANTGKSDQIPG